MIMQLIVLTASIVSLWFGALWIVAYLIYLGFDREAPTDEIPEGSFTWSDVPRLITGLVVVVGGAHFLVESASTLARAVGISEWLIG
ncbi:MAG: hypothetical protein AAF702_50100 [Chloroflexota bacterium]